MQESRLAGLLRSKIKGGGLQSSGPGPERRETTTVVVRSPDSVRTIESERESFFIAPRLMEKQYLP